MIKPKIAILGYGQEGQANLRYFKERGDITIVDQNPIDDRGLDGVKVITGPDAFSDLSSFDLLIRSPGIAPGRIQAAGKVWTSTNEFFANCPAPIIGVTGTKGKGTTSSLIAAILRRAGKTVHLVGNIGNPALDALANIKPDDIVIYELSSFQLWDIQYSPQVAVALMIEADHLDMHGDFDNYLRAKTQIASHQQASDTVVYNGQNRYSSQIGQASTADNKLDYMNLDMTAYADAIKLPGEHNLHNMAAAITAARAVAQLSDDQIRQGASDFNGLDHRLKYVATIDGVEYYDDSISTTPGSAIAAIKSFADRPKVIILGGRSKGGDYHQMIELCASTETKIIACGENGFDIDQLADKLQADSQLVAGDMEQVVAAAQQSALPGGVVVLSPAAASFDQYKNYIARGQAFVEAVSNLAN